jgi:hypothetical protein
MIVRRIGTTIDSRRQLLQPPRPAQFQLERAYLARVLEDVSTEDPQAGVRAKRIALRQDDQKGAGLIDSFKREQHGRREYRSVPALTDTL